MTGFFGGTRKNSPFAAKKQNIECGWESCREDSPVTVTLGRICGHTVNPDKEDTPIRTCQQHLEQFFAQGGQAKNASTCGKCGQKNNSRIVSVTDLN